MSRLFLAAGIIAAAFSYFDRPEPQRDGVVTASIETSSLPAYRP